MGKNKKDNISMQLIEYGKLNKNGRIYERGSVKFPKHDLPVVLDAVDLDDIGFGGLNNPLGHSVGQPTITDNGPFAELHLFPHKADFVREMLDDGCCFVPAMRDAVIENVDGVNIIKSASVCGYFLTAQPSFPVVRDEAGNFSIQNEPEDFDAA